MLKHPLPQVLSEGQDFTLLCVTGGHPVPNITWLFNDTEVGLNISHILFHGCCSHHCILQIMPSERHLISADFTSLTVLNVSVEMDSGIYTCLAQNFAGFVRHSSRVTITMFTSQFGSEGREGGREGM